MVGRLSSLPFPEISKELKSIRSHPDPQCEDLCLIEAPLEIAHSSLSSKDPVVIGKGLQDSVVTSNRNHT